YPEYEAVSDYGQDCFIPLTFGGGIRDSRQVGHLLRAGVDKVSINSAAHDDPSLIGKIAETYGTQCVVVSIDARQIGSKGWRAYSHAGQHDTGRDVVAWAQEMEARGAGELLITSIDRDGTFQGYDLPLIEAVAAAVSVPVIASGGAGSYQHMVEAVRQAGASAVAAASIFHFTELTPAGAKAAFEAAGIPVRRSFIDAD
ncbi:MAG: imidazole glycerol phosphate synthase subunit HisF, partial [Rhodobacterales bacterium]